MYAAKVTIDHTKVPSNLTDFPVYIDLAHLPSDFWNNVKKGGGDIRCYKSDGTTELAREVVRCAKLDDYLASYYAFSNGAYATDSVGSNTLTTTGSTQQSAGKNGYCGSGDNIRAATNFGLTGTADISISWWGKMTTDITSSGVGFFFMGSTLTTDRLLAMDYDYNGGTRRLNVYNSSNSISGSYNVTLGTSWHHFVLVRSGGLVSLYVDGVKVLSGLAQSSTTGGQDSLYLGTGKAYGGSSNYYYDELAVFTTAISQSQVTALYNSGTGLFTGFSSVKEGELHVKYAGTLSSSVDTEIQIHVDGTSSDYSASATYGRNNVWKSGYKAVLHHQDNAVDSTGNGDWTDTGSPTYDDVAPQRGVDISASTKWVTRNNDGGITRSAAMTMTSVQKFKAVATNAQSIMCWGDYAQSFYWEMRYENTGGWKLCSIKQTGSEIRNDVAYTAQSTNPTHLAMRFDGTNLVHYADATQIGTQAPSAGSASNSFMDNMTVGAIPHSTGYMQNFWGNNIVSETRFFLGDLGADWITAEKNNLLSASTFYTATTGSTNVTVSSSVVSATLSSPSRTVTGTANVTASVVSAVFSAPTRTVTGTANVTASVVSALFSIPAVNVITPDALVNASVLSATFSIPTATPSGSANTSVGVQSATFSIPSSSVKIDFSHAASVLNATFSIPAPTISAESNITVSPSVQTLTFSLQSVTVTSEQNAVFEAGVLTATFSLPVSTVTAQRNISIDASVISATFSVQAPRKVGGLWTPQGRTEGVWTPQPRAI